MNKSPEILENFRQRLFDLMDEHGWNVPDLAEHTGIKYTTLRGILGKDVSKVGKSGPSFSMIYTMITNLRSSGISADWLLTGYGGEGDDAPTSQTDFPESEPGQAELDGERENNVRSDEEMESDYDELAATVVDLLDMARDLPETFRNSFIDDLMSIKLVKEHLKTRKKKESTLKNAIVADSSNKERQVKTK